MVCPVPVFSVSNGVVPLLQSKDPPRDGGRRWTSLPGPGWRIHTAWPRMGQTCRMRSPIRVMRGTTRALPMMK